MNVEATGLGADKSLLLVDDDEPFLRRLAKAMEKRGFEIETVLRAADGETEYGTDGVFAWVGEIDTAETAEARDDRFVAAIDVVEDTRTLAYVVRAVTPGTFTMPGVVAEDMYRPDVFARSAASEIEIAPQVSGADQIK